MHLSDFENYDLYEMYFVFVCVCLLQPQHSSHVQRNKSGLFFSQPVKFCTEYLAWNKSFLVVEEPSFFETEIALCLDLISFNM